MKTKKEERFEKVVVWKTQSDRFLSLINFYGGLVLILALIWLTFLDVPKWSIAFVGFSSGYNIVSGVWGFDKSRKVYWRKVK